MEKKMVACRITIKAWTKGVTLAKYNTYGVQTDARRIRTAEGYEFIAGRKSGFGKSCYIYTRINEMPCKVTIDRIEEMA